MANQSRNSGTYLPTPNKEFEISDITRTSSTEVVDS
ncbi:MAG: hypothetical protein DDT18_01970 [Actinobacteria bacterium]|nr:hypothetical protein [Actinomycetota bacterium]